MSIRNKITSYEHTKRQSTTAYCTVVYVVFHQMTDPRPATPSTTRLSLVSVPVLSKQHTSIFPANGIRNGSVQNTSENDSKTPVCGVYSAISIAITPMNVTIESHCASDAADVRSFVRASSDELTASDSSMGSSGGTTHVSMSTHSRKSL